MLGISAVIGLQGRLRGSENPGVMGALVMEDGGKGIGGFGVRSTS